MKTTLTPLLLRLLGAAFLATASAACSGVPDVAPATPAPVVAATPAPATPAPVAAPGSAGLLQQLQAEIGEAACDTSAQCKTIAVGHKACGGPESYLAYSTKTANGAKLAKLAEDYAAERRKQDTKSGRMSTCSMAMDPGATCTAGRCATGGGTNLAR